MTRITQHKNQVRIGVFALLLIAILGPWGYAYDGVPPADYSSKSVRDDDTWGHCPGIWYTHGGRGKNAASILHTSDYVRIDGNKGYVQRLHRDHPDIQTPPTFLHMSSNKPTHYSLITSNKETRMNITVFGGTGDTGLLVIKKALYRGHSVTAFARTPSKIPFQHANLKIIKGELTEIDKIESALKNADAVISVLGPIGRTTELPVSNGIKNIVTAMKSIL